MATKDPTEEKDPKDTPEEKEEVVEGVEETTETPEEETVEETEENTEENEEAPEKTETKPEPEEKEEVFDTEEFKKQVTEEAEKRVADKIGKALGITKEEEKEIKKDGLTPPWEERGEAKPATWQEAMDYASDLALWKKDKREEEIQKTQEDNEKEAVEVNKRWNDYWDSELKELEELGEIPAVKDGNDPNDPGKKIRIKLFAKMQEIGLERQSRKLPPVTSAELIYRKFKNELNEEPTGSDAPVSFGKKAVGNTGEGDYSYSDIATKSFEQIKDQG